LVDASSSEAGKLMKEVRVFSVPRVGLNIAKDEGDYHSQPYRFISFLSLPHKENDRIKKYLTTDASLPVQLDEFNAYKKGMKW
jgi:hypothetical protein